MPANLSRQAAPKPNRVAIVATHVVILVKSERRAPICISPQLTEITITEVFPVEKKYPITTLMKRVAIKTSGMVRIRKSSIPDKELKSKNVEKRAKILLAKLANIEVAAIHMIIAPKVFNAFI